MTEYEWRAQRRGLLYAVVRCVRTDVSGANGTLLRYRNGFIRYFWTKNDAKARADLLNTQGSV